ncbi:MAG: hypothetical protein WAN43_16160 [Rhodomicrobium sp.]
MAYTLIANSSAITRDSDGATIPADPRNTDWQAYQTWLAAGNAPTPAPVPPTPVPSALMWQIAAVCAAPPSSLGFTPPTWAQVQAAVTALANPAVSAFAASGVNPIPANSTALAAINAKLATPMTAAQLTALIAAAAQISIS